MAQRSVDVLAGPHWGVPEIIEVELYRRAAARCVGRTIVTVSAPDEWYLKKGLTAASLIATAVGASVGDVRRRGKLLLLDLSPRVDEGAERLAAPPLAGTTIGLRFGMTGRIVIDGRVAMDELEYGSSRLDPAWVRVVFAFDGGGSLAVIDPRRLGAVELEPDEGALGPDAYTVTPAELGHALGDSNAPVKARLMDQTRVAGVGNLLADETFWRAGIDPTRPARTLTSRERARLARALVEVIAELTLRGGSHTGDLQDERHRGGRCPREGAELLRRTVGGRTTYSCPIHQR